MEEDFWDDDWEDYYDEELEDEWDEEEYWNEYPYTEDEDKDIESI